MSAATATGTGADPLLYVIIDPARAGGHDLVELARAAIAGGATLLQYRDKNADTRTLVARARAIVMAIAASGVPLLVNDRVDVAMAAGAGGVHLGQDDMHPDDARRLMGPNAIIGVSVTQAAHAAGLAGATIDRACDYACDYACIGAVFATTSKDDGAHPIGLSGLKDLLAIARRVAPGLPIGAISGIDESNAAAVIGAGADGIAVISAVSLNADPAGATRRLRRIVADALDKSGDKAGR